MPFISVIHQERLTKKPRKAQRRKKCFLELNYFALFLLQSKTIWFRMEFLAFSFQSYKRQVWERPSQVIKMYYLLQANLSYVCSHKANKTHLKLIPLFPFLFLLKSYARSPRLIQFVCNFHPKCFSIKSSLSYYCLSFHILFKESKSNLQTSAFIWFFYRPINLDLEIIKLLDQSPLGEVMLG